MKPTTKRRLAWITGSVAVAWLGFLVADLAAGIERMKLNSNSNASRSE